MIADFVAIRQMVSITNSTAKEAQRMKNKQHLKNLRHAQAVSRLSELALFRRLRLLDTPMARKKLSFVE